MSNCVCFVLSVQALEANESAMGKQLGEFHTNQGAAIKMLQVWILRSAGRMSAGRMYEFANVVSYGVSSVHCSRTKKC